MYSLEKFPVPFSAMFICNVMVGDSKILMCVHLTTINYIRGSSNNYVAIAIIGIISLCNALEK